MRLLFVDDDDRVLNGLRRRLHGRCPDWQAEFASGGAAGLAAIERSRFEAVVSDLRMPLVDGGRVLAETAQRHPRAVRLVLSGHADGRGLPRLSSCAHGFLDKPCATEALVAMITRSVERRAALDELADPRLDALWCRGPGLVPGLPEVLAALGGEGGDPEQTADSALDQDVDWLRVLAVAAAVRSDALQLDARPVRVIEVLGGGGVLAVLTGLRVQQAAGGNWSDRFARGTALAVAAYAAGRGSELCADELGDVLLAALLDPLSRTRSGHGTELAWLLGAWGIPERVTAALGAEGRQGSVGEALCSARRNGQPDPGSWADRGEPARPARAVISESDGETPEVGLK